MTWLVAVCVLLVPVAVECQAAANSRDTSSSLDADTGGLKIRLAKSAPLPTPFPLDETRRSKNPLVFLPREAMTESDRELVTANTPELVRLASIQGFAISEVGGDAATSWGYEQAVCPALPDHLVLEFSRSGGVGDLAVFSAVLPRAGTGRVRIIPVERRGFTLFTPASSNAMTINAFNHILNEDKDAVRGDWLGLGLCYAALAGGHVRAAVATTAGQRDAFPLYSPAMLSLSWKKLPEVSFSDLAGSQRVREWTLTFARDGQLKRVNMTTPRGLRELPTKEDASHETPKVVPGKIVELGSGKND